jgi:hypothetical protein
MPGDADDRHRPPERNYYWLSNPDGHNQFPDCRESLLPLVQPDQRSTLLLASKTSEEFLELLRNYHRTTTRRADVKALLLREHGIECR